MKKILTYEQFIQFGKDNYNNGGDCIVECWSKADFDEYVEMFGKMSIETAKRLIEVYAEQQRAATVENDAVEITETEQSADTYQYDDFNEFMNSFYDDENDRDEWSDYWSDAARSVGAVY